MVVGLGQKVMGLRLRVLQVLHMRMHLGIPKTDTGVETIKRGQQELCKESCTVAVEKLNLGYQNEEILLVSIHIRVTLL